MGGPLRGGFWFDLETFSIVLGEDARLAPLVVGTREILSRGDKEEKRPNDCKVSKGTILQVVGFVPIFSF